MSYFSNINGIPRLEANGVTLSETAATYNFDPRAFVPVRYSGLILFKLPAYTAPATAVPVVFNTAGNMQNLTSFGGSNVTSATLNGAGIILCYYENNMLQLLSVLPEATAAA